jgi:hypothetical protein
MNRPMLEGRPEDPRDFNHQTWRNRRVKDAGVIADYFAKQGEDITWWNNVIQGRQDPWAKMLSPEYDPNKQLSKHP